MPLVRGVAACLFRLLKQCLLDELVLVKGRQRAIQKRPEVRIRTWKRSCMTYSIFVSTHILKINLQPDWLNAYKDHGSALFGAYAGFITTDSQRAWSSEHHKNCLHKLDIKYDVTVCSHIRHYVASWKRAILHGWKSLPGCYTGVIKF